MRVSLNKNIMLFRNGAKKLEQIAEQEFEVAETDLFMARRLRDGDVSIVNKNEVGPVSKEADVTTDNSEVAK